MLTRTPFDYPGDYFEPRPSSFKLVLFWTLATIATLGCGSVLIAATWLFLRATDAGVF